MIKGNKLKFIILVLFVLVVGLFVYFFHGEKENIISHKSTLNPSMSDFFKQYNIYYTGWDNYLRNGEDLGSTQTGSSSIQAFELGMSKNSTSTATETEINRKMKKGEKEGRILTVMPNGSYVIEDHSPNETNEAFGSLAATLLRFNGDTYTRDAINSDYFVDQNHIIYIGCLGETFDESINGNLCSKYALYVDHNLIDQTSKSSKNNSVDLTISLIHNHIIYYSKTENSVNEGYFSYDLNTKTKSSLNAADGYDCSLAGFVKDKPVSVCDDYQASPLATNVLIGGVPTYHMVYSSNVSIANSKDVIVVNDHVYYTVTTKPDSGSSLPIKTSLIKDGLKVAEAEESSSEYFNGTIYPSDGSQTGCLFANDTPTPAFCIMGDNVISRSNYGFDQNEYYLNGQTIDFGSYYNVVLNTSDSKWDSKKPSIWQLDVLPNGNGQAVKIIFLNLEPNNIYVSDLLPDATISKPELLISNVGAIVGSAFK